VGGRTGPYGPSSVDGYSLMSLDRVSLDGGCCVSTPVSPEAAPPGLDRVGTCQDFARELTVLREQAGLTVRQVGQVASKVGVQGAHSTIGDWFAGRGLPSITSRDLLVQVLGVCGVDDAERRCCISGRTGMVDGGLCAVQIAWVSSVKVAGSGCLGPR
jgi:hypothetical protein